ncbi:uncharacterized protein C1orf87 homolog isoform X2 [Podarcis raffonei]|uniref:uncharacterized protein C1orf87 homolog isoform X2 n=1 Tax=Podarcis raffonei TaxID=65483 RepID=UPI0023296AF5|nr:uncharacterized protein C1orf87 homolog isoform X2 [Podarcis raffonei]
MASVRNIPYGFNANYETVIKIIGSKYVRCLVEKTDGKAKEGVKTETQSMLRTLAPHNARQAHRNPPGLNRPPCQQIHYGLRDEQQNKGEKEEQKSKQGETSDSRSVDNKGLKPLNTHCVTAPSGDKSLSYIHTLQKPSMETQILKQLERQQVNYEKLLQFLMPVAASKTQQTQALPRKSQNMENHCKSSWTPEDAFQALKQTLKEHKGELSLQDKTCSGLLSPSETEIICKKHGLTLPTGILEALVSTCEFGKRGKIEWKTFVEFLKKVQAGINPALLVCRRGNKEKNEDDSQDKEWSNRCAGKTWEQMKEVTYDSIDAEEQDAWIDRFRKLERALYLCDVKNTGKLEKEKAKRLIHNYNQIYDLCLSPLKIDKAFRPFRPGQDITLEPLLDYLKEL